MYFQIKAIIAVAHRVCLPTQSGSPLAISDFFQTDKFSLVSLFLWLSPSLCFLYFPSSFNVFLKHLFPDFCFVLFQWTMLSSSPVIRKVGILIVLLLIFQNI